MPADPAPLIGVDFTCTPSRRKPITAARGRVVGAGSAAARLQLDGVDAIADWPAFDALLRTPGPWVGAFDFPFGWPRAFVDSLALGRTNAEVMAALRARCPDRLALRALIDAWSAERPAGRKLPHRSTDTALGGATSTSPLQTRYVPVAFMAYEGLPRLLAAGLHLPGLHTGDAARIALEGYPGALVHTLIGRRSYKNAASADRLIARKDLVSALERGHAPGGMRLKLTPAQHDALVADASGDRLDAVLCLVQAAWAQAQPRWGLPPVVDPVEGWIVGARPAPAMGVAAAMGMATATATAA